MTSHPGVIVTLDGETYPAETPLLCADDLAVLRGEGVFETVLVRDGRARLVEPHLRRLAHSAAAMHLPEPQLPAWRHAIDAAARRWAAGSDDEAAMRLIYSRGRESGSAPTAYVMVTPLAERIGAARRDGIAAVTLERGLPAAGAPMPWLLAGAKTLSYAVNMAALRHAAACGADDVVFVSSDGYVLEGPRSTVIIATSGEGGVAGVPCLLTPPPWYPILRGTTQQALFEVARDAGFDCDYRALRPADLYSAQGVWLVSAVTLAARVHTLDDTALPPSPLAADLTELIDAAVGGR